MKPTDIIYIEDNADYIEFMRRAVNKVDMNLNFSVLMDGKDTLRYLEEIKTTNTAPRLILLDLNLPDYNGIELLARIRANASTRYTPVVMFSSSENQKDIKLAFDQGANAYLVKPMGLNPLMKTVEDLCDFWLHHNQLPVENFAA